MRLILAALLLLSTPSFGAAAVCTHDASAVTSTLTLNGICSATSYKIYKTGADSFVVVCAGSTPPAGAVELREFYVFPKYNGR